MKQRTNVLYTIVAFGKQGQAIIIHLTVKIEKGRKMPFSNGNPNSRFPQPGMRKYSIHYLVMKENKGTVWFASKYFILNNSEKSLFYSKFTIDIKESISQNFSHSLFLEQ